MADPSEGDDRERSKTSPRPKAVELERSRTVTDLSAGRFGFLGNGLHVQIIKLTSADHTNSLTQRFQIKLRHTSIWYFQVEFIAWRDWAAWKTIHNSKRQTIMDRSSRCRALSLLLLAAIDGSLFAQPLLSPEIQWQKTFGGSGNDDLCSLQQTVDGGFIVAGGSESPADGTKTSPNYGSMDFWLIKLDGVGNQVWEEAYGGTAYEIAATVRAAGDGGFVVGGHSFSGINGNKSAVNYGQCDYWMIRLSATGTKLWETSYGGGAYEQMSGAAESVVQTKDGGFAMLGYSMSDSSGNKSSRRYGNRDFWLVRTDSAGRKLWDQSYGGASTNWGIALAETGDGGFALGGYSASTPTGNKSSPNYGRYDFWIVRVDKNGNKLWDRSFGGSGDDILRCLIVTSDDGIAAAGHSSSPISGTKSSTNYGGTDAWVLRLDKDGNPLWERTFGGDQNDGIYDIHETGDGGYVLAGFSASGAIGSKTSANYGSADYWILRLDANGNRLWELSLGGTDIDLARSIQQTADGGFIVGGWSASGQGGNKTAPNYGLDDYWLIKLAPERPRLAAVPQSSDDIAREGFRMLLMPGRTNVVYRLAYSSDFTAWLPLQTNQAVSYSVPLTDGNAIKSSQRFYRVQRLE